MRSYFSHYVCNNHNFIVTTAPTYSKHYFTSDFSTKILTKSKSLNIFKNNSYGIYSLNIPKLVIISLPLPSEVQAGEAWKPLDEALIFRISKSTNPLNAELNRICHLLALLGAHNILHVSRIRVKQKNIYILRSSIQISTRCTCHTVYFI